MNRRLRTLCLLLVLSVFTSSVCSAAGYPDVRSGSPAAKDRRVVPAKPERFYGYVPPPPIRHTWPGGYRNIFWELNNTMLDHILGRY